MTDLLSKTEIFSRFPASSWQRIVFSEFEATVSSTARPFPCVFGVTGLAKDQLRFVFPDPLTPETLAPVLADYVAKARDFGRMTSLVAFGRPGPVQGIEDYRRRFWSLLDGLERLDTAARPADIPRDLDSDLWEFCFGGEPIFVVCNSPAHVLRQSRRSTSFMVTFQPRWVFDGIMDRDDPAQRRALDKVRDRLAAFDAIQPSPFLGHYGAEGNREYRQYFIDDTNEAPACPFHQLGRDLPAPQKRKGKVA
jgi:FPC/CPF motif-containing protein YcgG